FETLRAFDDESVVQARDCGVLPGGRPYLAMEYLDRGDVAQARLTHDSAQRLLHEAGAALASVHRRGWVHRDIKPAHFLLRAEGAVALCDFGSACRIGTRAGQTAPCVTG